MPYRAVIFDLQGTLVRRPHERAMFDSVRCMAEALGVDSIEFASHWFRHGSHSPSQRALPWIESNLEAVCLEMGVALDVHTRRRLAQMREALILQTLTPQRGAIKALTTMRCRGIRTAVIGDTPSDLPQLFHETEIARHIDVSLLSCSSGYRHDDPRVFRKVLESLGLPPSVVMYVSGRCDQSLDIASALKLRPIRFCPDLMVDGMPAPLCDYETRGTMLELTWLATGWGRQEVA
ncbi:MAG: HAD family hydrolase [Phycisphaerales bacterium JB063]